MLTQRNTPDYNHYVGFVEIHSAKTATQIWDTLYTNGLSKNKTGINVYKIFLLK